MAHPELEDEIGSVLVGRDHDAILQFESKSSMSPESEDKVDPLCSTGTWDVKANMFPTPAFPNGFESQYKGTIVEKKDTKALEGVTEYTDQDNKTHKGTLTGERSEESINIQVVWPGEALTGISLNYNESESKARGASVYVGVYETNWFDGQSANGLVKMIRIG